METQKRILIVDDEHKMRKLLASFFPEDEYSLLFAGNGDEAILTTLGNDVDLILLDIMMPGVDGYEACKRIRQFSTVPILMVTAKTDEEDCVKGLRLGADDYITKPFSGKELVARVEALLRRAGDYNQPEETDVLRFEELEVNEKTRRVKVGGNEIVMTRKEFNILLLLMKNEGKVISRDQIYHDVWGEETPDHASRTIDTHVKTLRLKLKEAARFIHTVWGVGYRFSGEEK
ncbi:response regulator transcription factor [Aliibacillus thermotolerans]|uniref:Response regulator transcription factor n=1 Tax=Aliibacillus thermotolerans TaxID=1834418 RepID=A0ABW0U418_9BACI|nr:response regulator transcription factor [Aliibacillus thermotolerans]MDA3128504.1 response regulator [Aliibacillus thermotolerans]